MSKRLLICVVALLIVACISVAADKGKEGSWTGWITDSMCGADAEKAKSADCVTKCISWIRRTRLPRTPAITSR